ncbi:MAG: D-glycerate dehydrogenase [Saprospiraceae bacterium]|nr:D-glycerate dehydrogenase [Saprospiraceae bacterium]
MSQTAVLISRQLPEKARELLSNAGFEVNVWEEERPMPKQELILRCQRVEALLCTSIDEIDAAFISSCSHLKVISTFAVGYDNIDLVAAERARIRIGHTPGVLTEATAEIAFGLMISVARHFMDAHHQIGNGEWKYFVPTKNLGKDLTNRTLGIFGLGAIGFEMARRCQAVYGMKIIYHNRKRNPRAEEELGASLVSFEALLERSDVISVHASLNDQTKGIFDLSAFAKMKESAIFINTARGGLHDEADLLHALKKGQIWGAGLDVTNPEPMNPDNPLLQQPRVLVLPHIGSSTEFTRDEMARIAAENIISFFENGNLVHEVRSS